MPEIESGGATASSTEAVERQAQVRALFAEWDEADRAIFEVAAQMTEAEMWANAEPMPEAEAAELREQLARIAARAAQGRDR